MTFLLDQDAPHDLTFSPRELGHGVVLLRDVLPITSDDATVLDYAVQNGYVLITCNRDDFLAASRDLATRALLLSSGVRPVLPSGMPSSSFSIRPEKLESLEISTSLEFAGFQLRDWQEQKFSAMCAWFHER